MQTVLNMNCLDGLRLLGDSSVDSIVTDPPYGLSFMGKKWDYDVPSVEIWVECLRVLKPGGHLLAFAGTRTQHRMACRIEDAGFEIRDMIAWIYGSGFPKSMDVSKQIDKLDAADARLARALRFTEWLRGSGLTSSIIDQLTGTCMGGHYLTAASQPAVATREHFELLRPWIAGEVPPWVEQMVDERTVESENFKQRQVIGQSANGIAGGSGEHAGTAGAYGFAGEYSLTVAHTEAARQWQGWGTALKPALEPITVARKPLVGTVAANVLKYGTGAVNIDGCRVGEGAKQWETPRGGIWATDAEATAKLVDNPLGRFPANLIHDGSAEVLAEFPDSKGQQGDVRGTEASRTGGEGTNCYGEYGRVPAAKRGDDGSAARFFYCAKTSKKDRDEGNTHPTVKPTALMRYLCRLVTPPGGLVLDPFTGSGSTGKAAKREGFRFLGFELFAKYCETAKARIDAAILDESDN